MKWLSTVGALGVAALAAWPARVSQEAPSSEVLRSYFSACDRNADGWISYRESHESLDLDRAAYRILDTDSDGRVIFDEFSSRYAALSERLGAIPPPHAIRTESRDLPRAPTQVLAAYDKNGDGALAEQELGALLVDYGRSQFSISLAMEKLDQDSDGRLRGGELELVSRLLTTFHVIGRDSNDGGPPPRSVEELFGRVVERSANLDAPPQPPLILGPVSHFRRLDLDASGGIDLADLETLVRPGTSPISLAAVFAGLDRNEDGVLDVAEFEDSMR